MKRDKLKRLLLGLGMLVGMTGSVWGAEASLKIKAANDATQLFAEQRLRLHVEKTGLEQSEAISWTSAPLGIVTITGQRRKTWCNKCGVQPKGL